MIEAIFIFTAATILTGLFKMTSLVFGNDIDLPPLVKWRKRSVGPTYFLIWYPSAMFQVWFWTNNLGVFA